MDKKAYIYRHFQKNRLVFNNYILFFFLRLASIVPFMSVGVLIAASLAETNPQVFLKTRLGIHPNKTRLVLELPTKTSFEISRTSSSTHHKILLKSLNFKNLNLNSQKGKGLIHSFFFDKGTHNTLRLHIKTLKESCLDNIFLLPQTKNTLARLVIDIKALKRLEALEVKRPLSSVPKRSFSEFPSFMPIPLHKPLKYTVVIDAGHGGQDPGTIGLNDLYEKNITLMLACEIKEQLCKLRQYRVVLTRDKDQSMRLRERFARAREVKADLFISLHADSHPNKNVRGLSVYTLSDQASDKEAALLAKKENKADVIGGFNFDHESIEVANILIDLTQRYTMDLSINFAQEILNCIAKEKKLSENSHRFADFEVLKAHDVPSVLVEVGYLSNPDDVARLSQKKFRQVFALSMVRAINQYFQKLKR